MCVGLLHLPEYNDTMQENNRECTEGQYFLQDDPQTTEKEACRFRRGLLSLCSGLSDLNYGYAEGKPCILLKMNRVTLKHPSPLLMCAIVLFSLSLTRSLSLALSHSLSHFAT